MEHIGLNDLREKFLSFFESKQHLRLKSFPLVPHGDKSLLLINSGMAPMKKWFLGTEEPPSHRVCTCQKCIRTPDIESVGITSRHGTFFLGTLNCSLDLLTLIDNFTTIGIGERGWGDPHRGVPQPHRRARRLERLFEDRWCGGSADSWPTVPT